MSHVVCVLRSAHKRLTVRDGSTADASQWPTLLIISQDWAAKNTIRVQVRVGVVNHTQLTALLAV
jgi:hypothetical protein